MYEYIGILLGAHPILHISRIRVKEYSSDNAAVSVPLLMITFDLPVSKFLILVTVLC
jgi:hypothetical protein